MSDIVPAESKVPENQSLEGEVIEFSPFQRALVGVVELLTEKISDRDEAGRVYELLDAMVTGVSGEGAKLPPHEMKRLRQDLNTKFADLPK